MKYRLRSLFAGISLILLFGLGMGPCAAEFDLGVGAFEIGPNSAILWTRALPIEANRSSVVVWSEVATDPDFADIVRVRAVAAHEHHDFTARTQVRGLAANTQYYYRFRSPTGISPSGAFRTAPHPEDDVEVRFVISGDSNLGYTAPRGLDFHVLSAAAAEDPDFFVYFGDTIYADSGILPTGDAFTLDEYRAVHRLTRADPHLQTLLASTGTYSGWDDHEVRNDYAGETVDPAQFENGARAFFEYLPLRVQPSGAPYRIDRTVRWGEHVELFFLDGRQFRSAERFCNPDPIPDGEETPDTLFSPFVEDEIFAVQVDPVIGPIAAALLLLPSDPDCVANELADPTRTMLGPEQLAALQQALVDSDATFKIIINNVPISSIFVTPYDRWEGYLAERQTLLDFIAANLDPDHTLVLSTDFHTNLAIRRPEFTEVVVGPIGQTTFGQTVLGILAGLGLPPALVPIFLELFEGVVDLGNGAGSVLASAPDAFSYALVEVTQGAGGPQLTVTARGNPNYLAGNNDPDDVVDLFTIQMP
jgi:phosphodiesterase/alkaline phosphatase D-like protein